MRLIGVLDHQLVKPKLSPNLAKQGRVRFVQAQPHYPVVTACNGADFLDRDIAYPLTVTVKRARDYPKAAGYRWRQRGRAYQSKTLILRPCEWCPWSALPRPERLGLTMK